MLTACATVSCGRACWPQAGSAARIRDPLRAIIGFTAVLWLDVSVVLSGQVPLRMQPHVAPPWWQDCFQHIVVDGPAVQH